MCPSSVDRSTHLYELIVEVISVPVKEIVKNYWITGTQQSLAKKMLEGGSIKFDQMMMIAFIITLGEIM